MEKHFPLNLTTHTHTRTHVHTHEHVNIHIFGVPKLLVEIWIFSLSILERVGIVAPPAVALSCIRTAWPDLARGGIATVFCFLPPCASDAYHWRSKKWGLGSTEIYTHREISIYLSISLSLSLSLSLSIDLCIYPSIHLSIYPSIYLHEIFS